jgi:hypothetical protein
MGMSRPYLYNNYIIFKVEFLSCDELLDAYRYRVQVHVRPQDTFYTMHPEERVAKTLLEVRKQQAAEEKLQRKRATEQAELSVLHSTAVPSPSRLKQQLSASSSTSSLRLAPGTPSSSSSSSSSLSMAGRMAMSSGERR